MTITRREKAVPIFLPPARIYLDDIEEIVRILVEPANRRDPEDRPESTFRVGDLFCDEVKDLPKIGTSTQDFELQISQRTFDYTARLGIAWWGCQWTTTGLAKEEAWGLFHKLEAVFESRKLSDFLTVYIWRTRSFGAALALGSAIGLVTGWFTLPHRPVIVGPLRISIATLIATVAVIVVPFAVAKGIRRLPGVMFRYSWDQAARQRENLWKLIPAIFTGVIGLISGIVLTYLKHRFWP